MIDRPYDSLGCDDQQLKQHLCTGCIKKRLPAKATNVLYASSLPPHSVMFKPTSIRIPLVKHPNRFYIPRFPIG